MTLQWRHISVTAADITGNRTVRINSLSILTTKITSKIRIEGSLRGESSGKGWMHLHRVIHVGNVSMPWHRNGTRTCVSSHQPTIKSLRWRHNGRYGVSSHQPQDCLLNRIFRRRSKKTSKLRVTGLCAGNSPHKWPVTRKMFPLDDVSMY